MHTRQDGAWQEVHSRCHALWAMHLLIGAIFGIFLVLATLAAPGAVRAATEDGSDLPKLVVVIVVDGLPQE